MVINIIDTTSLICMTHYKYYATEGHSILVFLVQNQREGGGGHIYF